MVPIAALGLFLYNITQKKVEARKTSSFEGCKVSKSIPDEGKWTALTTLRGKKNDSRRDRKLTSGQIGTETDRQKTFPVPNGLVSWDLGTWKYTVEEACSLLFTPYLPWTSLGFISLLIVSFKITNALKIILLSPVRLRFHQIFRERAQL